MKTAEALDPAETLAWMRDHFAVDAAAGIVVWTKPPKNHLRLLGQTAGSERPTHSGKFYVHIKKGGRAIKRGWLIFLWLNGRWPEPELDHRDGDSLNDAFHNIREATATQNAQNHKRRARRVPLPMGVRAMKSGRFEARIILNKKMIHLGGFDTPESAHAAYLNKRKELYREFA